MRAEIDREGCISCGLCPTICPEVFHMAEDGKAEVHQDPVPSEAEEGAVEAQISLISSHVAVCLRRVWSTCLRISLTSIVIFFLSVLEGKFCMKNKLFYHAFAALSMQRCEMPYSAPP